MARRDLGAGLSPHAAIARALLYTFDMIELDGQDLRREQIEARKAELAKLLRNRTSALRSRRRRWVHSHGER
jgi:ATP-dependent DNA ligase